jgi:hypothetical protein
MHKLAFVLAFLAALVLIPAAMAGGKAATAAIAVVKA